MFQKMAALMLDFGSFGIALAPSLVGHRVLLIRGLGIGEGVAIVFYPSFKTSWFAA